MRKLSIGVAMTVALVATTWVAAICWRAHKDLVTLHVRNAPLDKVIASLRWQTWETLVVNTNVHGVVTLDVDRMPLDGVLEILGEQLNARWSSIFPVYREKTSLISLKRALRGEVKIAETHFTNNQTQFIGPGRPDGLKPQAVTLHLTNTDLMIGALALDRFGGGQVLVESGMAPKISLELNGVSFEQAVESIARVAKRSSTKLYVIQGARFPGSPRNMAGARDGRPASDPGSGSNAEKEAVRLDRIQQVIQVLPEEQQKQAAERELQRLTMQSLTPEQRQQAMSARLNSPEMQARAEQRSISGIRNTTPEQRRDRYERMYQMRKARGTAPARNG